MQLEERLVQTATITYQAATSNSNTTLLLYITSLIMCTKAIIIPSLIHAKCKKVQVCQLSDVMKVKQIKTPTKARPA
jgi:hypothetical protein